MSSPRPWRRLPSHDPCTRRRRHSGTSLAGAHAVVVGALVHLAVRVDAAPFAAQLSADEVAAELGARRPQHAGAVRRHVGRRERRRRLAATRASSASAAAALGDLARPAWSASPRTEPAAIGRWRAAHRRACTARSTPTPPRPQAATTFGGAFSNSPVYTSPLGLEGDALGGARAAARRSTRPPPAASCAARRQDGGGAVGSFGDRAFAGDRAALPRGGEHRAAEEREEAAAVAARRARSAVEDRAARVRGHRGRGAAPSPSGDRTSRRRPASAAAPAAAPFAKPARRATRLPTP